MTNAKTLSELASLCGATLHGDGARSVDGPASLVEAGPRHISFLANPRYRSDLATTRAAAVVVGLAETCTRSDLVLLRCKDPSRAFSAVIVAFVEPDAPPPPGIHASAVVDASASIAPDTSIGPCCVVGPGAFIGARAVLRGNVYVGAHARVGPRTILNPGVVLYARVEVGADCILQGGTVLGSDGFGFEPTAAGWTKIPQCGSVIVEDDVEIGANVAIDRARFGVTRIGRGTKIDNLVHIAHNVSIGEASLVIAQVGIAGSAKIGKRVIIAGQAGVNGHAHIGDGARIAGQSGAYSDVPAGQDYMGSPARPRGETLRQMAVAQKLPELASRLRELEKRLAALEGKTP